jgi:SOS-response transcriptional repressor LexA
MQELTKRQQQIYDYIASRKSPICPTIAEIAEAIDVSDNCVKAHLLRMKKKGVVTWDIGKARTIRIVK